MTTQTSAPIGSTGQSLEGVSVNTGAGSNLFRESVVLSDPNQSDGYAPIVSTQPINFYGLPVWLQGTPTVQITSAVQVTPTGTTQVFGAVSSQITNVPTVNVTNVPLVTVQGTSSVNVISTVPHAITGTSQVFGTVSTQIVSSIPFFVAQSSAPWTMNGGVSVTNTPTVNVTNVPQVTVQGTSSVNVLNSITVQGTSSVNVLNVPTVNVTNVPLVTVQGTSSVNVLNNLTIQGTSSVNVLGAIPGTTQVNIVSSASLDTTYDSSTNATPPAQMAYIGGRVSTTNPTSIGNASTAAILLDRSGTLIAAPALREMVSATTVTLTSTSAETTLIPATASEFHDISNLLITNASSSPQVLTLRDGTGGTQRLVCDFNSTYANPISINFNPPLAQSTSNANWTIQPSTSSLFQAHIFVSWLRKST